MPSLQKVRRSARAVAAPHRRACVEPFHAVSSVSLRVVPFAIVADAVLTGVMGESTVYITRRLASCVLFLAAVLAPAVRADATPILRIESLSTIFQITDNGAGDLDPTAGVIAFSGAVGAYNINVTTGLSTPVVGSPSTAVMDLNSVSVTSLGSTAPLTITFGDTGFSLPVAVPGFITPTAHIGGTLASGATLDVASYINLADASPLPAALVPGAVVIPAGSLELLSALYDTAAFSDSGSAGVWYAGDPFSLFTEVSLTMPSAGSVSSFDVTTTVPVPEPVTVTLVGSTLCGMAWQRRRRRHRTNSTEIATRRS